MYSHGKLKGFDAIVEEEEPERERGIENIGVHLEVSSSPWEDPTRTGLKKLSARSTPRIWIYYLYRKSRDRAARGRYSWLEFAIGSCEYYSIHEFLKMLAMQK